MSITLTSSSTPVSLSHLDEKLAREGGLQGLMNKTIKHSLIKTHYFELSLVTPPDGQRHYVIDYFDVTDNGPKTKILNTYEEAQAVLQDIFTAREAQAAH